MRVKQAKVLIAVLCVVLPGVFAYSAVTNIIAVGTIPNSELLGGPATITVRQLLIAPGEVLAWHYHPGHAYNVVKRGTLTSENGCGQVRTIPAGQGFDETEYDVHRAMNLGTEELEIYNTFVVPEGNPTTVNIPNNTPRCGSLKPLLTLAAVRYCPGGSWVLSASNGVPDTTVHLAGTQNGNPWKTSGWGRTDANGNLTVNGTFPPGTEGDYTLKVDIGGLPSNAVSFAVSKCAP
jgi:quercetin dioxygenase-like cupin family protein